MATSRLGGRIPADLAMCDDRPEAHAEVMDNPLVNLSSQLSSIVARTASSVVTVHARPRITSSGVIWRSGLVLTADHALSRDKEIHLTLPDGSSVEAEIRGRDRATDVAVLEYSGGGEAATFAPDLPLNPGALLLAVGRNADTGATASLGILSAAGGPWRTWRGGQLTQFLRLDMGLFPGSTGGAVVDAEGRFIGIASDALSRLSPIAIPAATVLRVAEEIVNRGKVARAYLGVGVQPVKIGGDTGLIVLSVEQESAAEKSGLLVGDVLTSADQTQLKASEDLLLFLEGRRPGDKVTARIVRGGEGIELGIELGERLR